MYFNVRPIWYGNLQVKLIESQTDSQQNQDVNLTECWGCKERPVIIAQGLVDFQVELKLIKANSPRLFGSLPYTDRISPSPVQVTKSPR